VSRQVGLMTEPLMFLKRFDRSSGCSF
jgi:hypothetical protein